MCKICIPSDITSFLLWQLSKSPELEVKWRKYIVSPCAKWTWNRILTHTHKHTERWSKCIKFHPLQHKMSNVFQNFMTFFRVRVRRGKNFTFNSIYLWIFFALADIFFSHLPPWFSRHCLTNNNNIKLYVQYIQCWVYTVHSVYVFDDGVKRKAHRNAQQLQKKEYYSRSTSHSIASREILLANGKFIVFACLWEWV